MTTRALWMLSIDTSNDSSGGERILYALTTDSTTIPDPNQMLEIALPGESLYCVNHITLLHGEIDIASADVNDGHPLTQMGRSFVNGARFFESPFPETSL